MPRQKQKWKSDLEDKFLKRWKADHPRIPIQTQFMFHPVRKWRFDFAFPAIYLAIEIQGFGEGHNSYMGMATDYEKYNEAARYGWALLCLMAHDLEPKTIPKTMDYVHETILLRVAHTSTITSLANGISPRKMPTPQQLFERLKNAKRYVRKRR